MTTISRQARAHIANPPAQPPPTSPHRPTSLEIIQMQRDFIHAAYNPIIKATSRQHAATMVRFGYRQYRHAYSAYMDCDTDEFSACLRALGQTRAELMANIQAAKRHHPKTR